MTFYPHVSSVPPRLHPENVGNQRNVRELLASNSEPNLIFYDTAQYHNLPLCGESGRGGEGVLMLCMSQLLDN